MMISTLPDNSWPLLLSHMRSRFYWDMVWAYDMSLYWGNKSAQNSWNTWYSGLLHYNKFYNTRRGCLKTRNRYNTEWVAYYLQWSASSLHTLGMSTLRSFGRKKPLKQCFVHLLNFLVKSWKYPKQKKVTAVKKLIIKISVLNFQVCKSCPSDVIESSWTIIGRGGQPTWPWPYCTKNLPGIS